MSGHTTGPESLADAALLKHKWSYSLIAVCESLHGSMGGSGDPLLDERAAADFIRMRIDEFGEPRDQYDAAVRHLALMLLLEWDRLQPTCFVCGGQRATPEDVKRAQDLTLPDESQPWELGLCWAMYDGAHAAAGRLP